MKYIITYTPELEKAVLLELKELDKNVEITERFGDFIALIETRLSAKTFLQELLKKDPIFIKHIMPVNEVIGLSENKETALREIYNTASQMTNLQKSQNYSVQARVFNKTLDFNSKDIEVFVGSKLEKDFGGQPTFSDYKLKESNILTVSIMIKRMTAYIGVSMSEENLNAHSDEYRIFSRNGGRQISRAENKLKEAISKFNLKVEGALAMDIGAAPGGWTKVLADEGFMVHAVDPAKLHSDLLKNPNIKHFKGKVQDFKLTEKYDLIVNDMNVYPDMACDIMLKVHPYLKEHGNIVCTIKFIDPRIQKTITEVNKQLSKKYKILKIKNLFHNRKEVTYLLEKKSD